MRNDEVARQFVKERATEGTGSNMFIEGDAIYSYGRHFPIAVRLANGNFLFNEGNYSATTSKHQSHVRAEIREDKRIIADTKTLQKAIDIGAKYVVEIERTVLPDTFPAMQRQIKAFLKSKGFGRRASTRSKKFIEEMKKLAVLENV